MDERLSLTNSDPGSVAQHIARYDYFQPYTKGCNVLDAACGTGYGSRAILAGGALSYTGVDLSLDALREAQELYSQPNARFLQKSILDLQDLGKFKVIFSFETIEHIREYEEFLLQIQQVLDEQGIFFVSTPVRKSGALADPPRNPFHTQEWTEKEFTQLLSKYFQISEKFYQFGYRAWDYPWAEVGVRRLWRILAPGQHAKAMKFPVVKEASELKTNIPLEPIFQIFACKNK